MKWSRTPPPVPGWYWWKARTNSEPQPSNVRVRIAQTFYGNPWRMCLRGSRVRISRVHGFWWTTPMQPPPEMLQPAPKAQNSEDA